ncbi:hypothetical protein [Pseudomonas promysalinigenes]|uniref:Glycosyltransferase family 1 protein n=1 Tax=Pseudomonas promysalinigenes TaxID=485898 RepID=A0ABY6APR8_9PSED|nr:hypothetical protein [Pseudomonas promysalinigenes]UXH41308.1 hypothetical protein N5C08_07145 [Pseudomonas promysalinigenes]
MNFLLVSETPVAGTVTRFASALDDASGSTTAFPFVLRNYKNSPFDLPYGQMSVHENWANLLGDYAREADHVIFHNCTQQSHIDIVRKSVKAHTTLNYHLHSPPFEPPLFCYDIITNNSFDNVFSVAQGYARFYKDSIPIANIIPDIKIFQRKHRRSAVIVGHLRTTSARWSKKIPANFAKEFEHLLNREKVEIFTIPKLFGSETVPYKTFSQALQSFDYVVDDICSGLFHQISIEGLKSGCIVFSAADEYSIGSFCEAAKCPPPPFEKVADIYDIYEKIRFYERNPSQLESDQIRNLNYASKYLGEQRLSEIFVTRTLNAIEKK